MHDAVAWMNFDTLAWVDIALGTLIGIPSLIKLSAGGTRPRATEPGARSRPWLALGVSLILLLAGVSFLGAAAKNDAVQWAGLLGACAVVFWATALWLRARAGAKAAAQAH